MIDTLFRKHPRSVGETYAEHFAVASRVGLIMIGGGLAALIHAVCPALCVTTARRALQRLDRMLNVGRGSRNAAQSSRSAQFDWVI